MEITKQTYFDRIGDFINECHLTSYKRLCDGYGKMSCWLRNNGLETHFLKLHTAFLKMRGEFNFMGVTSDLIVYANDVAAKAKILADECYKHEDCWNPTLDRELTKVIGHTFTITEWMRTQSEFIMLCMKRIAEYYDESCKTSK